MKRMSSFNKTCSFSVAKEGMRTVPKYDTSIRVLFGRN